MRWKHKNEKEKKNEKKSQERQQQRNNNEIEGKTNKFHELYSTETDLICTTQRVQIQH